MPRFEIFACSIYNNFNYVMTMFQNSHRFWLIFLLFAKYLVIDSRYIGASARMRDTPPLCRTENKPHFISNVARNIDVILRNISRASGSLLSSTHTADLKEFL